MNQKIEEIKKKLRDLDTRHDKHHLELLEQMIEIEPENNLFLMEKASVLAAMGKDEEAISTYDKVIEMTGHDFGAYFRKGEILRALGNEKEAEVCFHKASNPDEE